MPQGSGPFIMAVHHGSVTVELRAVATDAMASAGGNMKKLLYGFIIGFVLGFPLGINFGKDQPLWSNPFAAKPDLSERLKERAADALQDAKEAIHEATEPARKEVQKEVQKQIEKKLTP